MPSGSSPRKKGRIALLPLALLGAGLLLRAGIFDLPHREGDERIYAALVEQVRAGRGYTLQGHPVLEQDWMIRDQYDTPVFYHPPAGVAWMTAFVALFGPAGLDLAQLAAFALFFAAMWGLARETLGDLAGAPGWVVGVLAVATPIAAHVSVHRWLDGPQVAAVALAAWLAVRALARGGALAAVGAGMALGVAMLVKMNAAIVVPPILLLAWVSAGERPARDKARLVLVMTAVAGAAVLPWLAVAPGWAGKPSARLVAENPFIRHVTVERSAWVYVRLVPTAVWTLVPAIAASAVFPGRPRSRAVPWALSCWIAVVVAVAIGLGALGYSKLLRYVVLIAPATILLAGWAAMRLRETLATRLPTRGLAIVLSMLLGAGVILEAAHGVRTILVHPDLAWIRSISGGSMSSR